MLFNPYFLLRRDEGERNPFLVAATFIASRTSWRVTCAVESSKSNEFPGCVFPDWEQRWDDDGQQSIPV